MKADARRALRELVANTFDPASPFCMDPNGLGQLIRYMLAHPPWAELVDLPAAIRVAFDATKRVEGTDRSDLAIAGLPPPRELWINTVTNEILRYPRSYVVLIQLPGLDISGDIDIPLDGRSRLIRSTLSMPASTFGMQVGLGLIGALSELGGLKPKLANQGNICLEIRADGQLDVSEGSSAASGALARAKQILQLLTLSSSMTIDHQFAADRRESQMFGYEIEREGEIVRVEMSEQLRLGLGSCRYTPERIKTGLLGVLGTPQEMIVRALEPFVSILSASNVNHDAVRILTGLEWAFDAAVERNETQALLNACIGLEAVLGKPKETGLTERLADRCAYMLGRGAQQRNHIADTFRSIYEVRSNVVHGRSRRLEPAQKGMLESARSLLRDVLRREAAEFPAQQKTK